MKGLLVVGLLVLVVGGGYFAYSSMQSKSTTPANTTGTSDGAKMEKETGAVATGAKIEIKSMKHSPSVLTVKPGAVVTVTNGDLAGHTVTSDTGLFDTGIVSNGKSVTFTAPMTPGSYPYHCTPHPSMTGTLVVAQ